MKSIIVFNLILSLLSSHFSNDPPITKKMPRHDQKAQLVTVNFNQSVPYHITIKKPECLSGKVTLADYTFIQNTSNDFIRSPSECFTIDLKANKKTSISISVKKISNNQIITFNKKIEKQSKEKLSNKQLLSILPNSYTHNVNTNHTKQNSFVIEKSIFTKLTTLFDTDIYKLNFLRC